MHYTVTPTIPPEIIAAAIVVAPIMICVCIVAAPIIAIGAAHKVIRRRLRKHNTES